MADALRALVDAVGLQVAYSDELEAEPGSAWTHHFPSPDAFVRWFRTLAARGALLNGDDPAAVAYRYGYPSIQAMRRTLTRVEQTVTRLPSPDERSRILR